MLKDPPLLTIRRNFERPSRDLIAKLAGAQTGHIVDALLGRGALDQAVKPVDPERAQFVGAALTCETGPSDNLAILAAIAVAEPGDVIVAASDGFSATAVVGDNVAAMAKNKGVVAIVIDGMARDSEGIVGVGLPVFARGITPNSCVRSGPGKIGLPIVCGGVAVQPGDVVLGDRDGVVIIPRADAGRHRRQAGRHPPRRGGDAGEDPRRHDPAGQHHRAAQVRPRRLRRLSGAPSRLRAAIRAGSPAPIGAGLARGGISRAMDMPAEPHPRPLHRGRLPRPGAPGPAGASRRTPCSIRARARRWGPATGT